MSFARDVDSQLFEELVETSHVLQPYCCVKLCAKFPDPLRSLSSCPLLHGSFVGLYLFV